MYQPEAAAGFKKNLNLCFQRSWQPRPAPNAISRGRGGSLERGGRVSRGRGTYQTYGRTAYEGGGGWGNGEQTEWSPRKDFVNRSSSVDNWRRNRGPEEEDGWRSNNPPRVGVDKWGKCIFDWKFFYYSCLLKKCVLSCNFCREKQI